MNIMKLPRNNKEDNFQDYTNNEVRIATTWSKRYFNHSVLLCFFHPYVYYQWLDYKGRVRNANYNYWIICYAFGI